MIYLHDCKLQEYITQHVFHNSYFIVAYFKCTNTCMNINFILCFTTWLIGIYIVVRRICEKTWYFLLFVIIFSAFLPK